MGIAALGVLLQVLWIVWAALKLTRYYAWVQLAIRHAGVSAGAAHLRPPHKRHQTFRGSSSFWPFPSLASACIFCSDAGRFNIIAGGSPAPMLGCSPLCRRWTALPCPRTRPCKTRSTTCRPRLTIPPATNTDVTYYGDTNAALGPRNRPAQSPALILWSTTPSRDSIAWQGIEDILAETGFSAGSGGARFYDDMGSIGFVDTHFAKSCSSRASSAGYSTPSCRC